jgi:hypothetical protein
LQREVTAIRPHRWLHHACGNPLSIWLMLHKPEYHRAQPSAEAAPIDYFLRIAGVERIDCVRGRTIYEVCKLNNWKGGLGQLCAYKAHFAARKSILYLYDSTRRPRMLKQIEETCSGYGITVAYRKCEIPVKRAHSTLGAPAD